MSTSPGISRVRRYYIEAYFPVNVGQAMWTSSGWLQKSVGTDFVIHAVAPIFTGVDMNFLHLTTFRGTNENRTF